MRSAPFDGDQVAVHLLVDRAQVVKCRPPTLHNALPASAAKGSFRRGGGRPQPGVKVCSRALPAEGQAAISV